MGKKTFGNRLHDFLSGVKKWFFEMEMRLYRWTHKRVKNKIVFRSFNGSQYSCNPRTISERLHERMPEADIVWCFNEQRRERDLPEYIRCIPEKGMKYRHEMATASVWVSNFELHRPICKSRHQFYIQTWHGDRGFKKIFFDADPSRPRLLESKLADLCVAGSEYGCRKFRSAFRYKGDILQVGMPRNDSLVCQRGDRVQKTRETLGIPTDVKVLLYAPTFRDAKAKEKQTSLIDISHTLDILEEGGESWVCLVRAHAKIKAGMQLEDSESDKRIIDATFYEDMADLLPLTDILISDYSSCANDFVLTGKPVVLAIFDEEDYVKQSRAFTAAPRDVGHICAASQAELDTILRKTEDIDWVSVNEKINAFYGTTETGNSTDILVDCIIEHMR